MKNAPVNQNDTNNQNTTPEANAHAAKQSEVQPDAHAATSSESLVDSEMSVGRGAVTGEEGNEVNKEANPLMMGQNPDRVRLSGNRTN